MDESNPNPYRSLEVENESLVAPSWLSKEPTSATDLLIIFIAVGGVGAMTALMLHKIIGVPLGRSPISLPAIIGFPGIASGIATFRVMQSQRLTTIACAAIVGLLGASTVPLCTFWLLGQIDATPQYHIRLDEMWLFVGFGVAGCSVCIPIALAAGWLRNKKAKQTDALAESISDQLKRRSKIATPAPKK